MEILELKQNISKFKKIFCDSVDALEWAYDKGVDRKSIIYTSSPALLFSNKPNIRHIESFWRIDKMKDFQTTIRKFSEDVFDLIQLETNLTHEESICIARESVLFNRILFKAACLSEADLNSAILFIKVNGYGGDKGNNMNSPWSSLLSKNPFFEEIVYMLEDEIEKTDKNSISIIERLKVAGIETLVYRFLTYSMRLLPNFMFNKSVLIPSENELLIEISSHLGLNGIQIKKLNLNKNKYRNNYFEKEKYKVIESILSSIVRSRIEKWVSPSLVSTCEQIFFEQVNKSLNLFARHEQDFNNIISTERSDKSILLTNSPVNLKGLALSSACNKNHIPVISVQHGIAKEISQNHGEVSASYEINASDCFIAYNDKSAEISLESHFRKGFSYVSGISGRHLRMKNFYKKKNINIPIVFISTNLYKGNIGMFTTWLTDYERALNEQKIIENVLSKLPHQVTYKTYPESNRRYPDLDPVLNSIKSSRNINLFDKKIDMRYLLVNHRVIITSKATSTIGWPIMAGKPVIFINYPDNNPLSNEAYNDFSSSLFLFDGNNKNFYNDLFNFLSKPIYEIESLWAEKSTNRNLMINKYFSKYYSKSGIRAAKMIMNKFYENSGNYSS